jgi:hypothetical protein
MRKWILVASLLTVAAIISAGCSAGATPAALTPVPASETPAAPQATATVAAPTQAAPTLAPTPLAGGTAAPTGTGITVIKGNVSLEFKGAVYDAQKKQAILNLSGNLPTPCHKLQTDVSAPDDQKQIKVSVYSLVDPNVICAQVIKPFEAAVPLGTLASGSYTVLVNGQSAGSVTVP